MTTTDNDIRPRIRRTHIALYVKDPFAAAGWYEDVLGMQVTARGEKWVFLSFGTKHHDIALIQADPPAEGQQPRGQINLQHYGLEIEGDLDELRRLHGMLLRKKVPIVKTTDHKVGIGLYFTDPDGHRLEFFCETVHDDAEGKRLLGAYNAPSDPYDLQPL
ncbi:MAG: VOC family protein [Burkholderiaceae bacterium]|nr:VOC family protein [Rhodoferax sp.]MCB2031694.1 VOC family protein [Rhodoferax sp.]MCB2041838.1 VOC family protein [Rhodoferax sp.]MCP5259962.1 VOC family protein [Rhodoferax sp.]